MQAAVRRKISGNRILAKTTIPNWKATSQSAPMIFAPFSTRFPLGVPIAPFLLCWPVRSR
jgi:hypothetical protein